MYQYEIVVCFPIKQLLRLFNGKRYKTQLICCLGNAKQIRCFIFCILLACLLIRDLSVPE